MADNNTSALINQMQATINELNRVAGERTRATRQMGVPTPAVTGGTGDPDQRRMYTSALQGQILIQEGMNGWQSGHLTLNMAPTIYKQNLPVLTNWNGPSVWGQTRLTPGVVPFLSSQPFIPSCGQIQPTYGGTGGGAPTTQVPAPGNTSGFETPPSWPTPGY